MNGFEFYELAKKTRAAQRLYFKSRLHGDLINAKNLERELDRAIEAGIEEEIKKIPVNWILHPAYSQGRYDHTEGIRRGQNPYTFAGDQASGLAWWAGWDASEAEDHKFENMEKDNDQ